MDEATEIIEADLAWAPSSEFLQQLAGQVPHIEQYFGVWAIYEETFRGMVEQANRLDLRAHIRQSEGSDLQMAAASREYAVTTGGVAVLEARGTLMKYASSMSSNTSTIALRRQVRSAVRDEDVSSILLRIDSPGGTVYGTYDLVDDIREASKQKPVYAYIEDLGASAAYAVASVATKVFANPSALVGSIGTFAVLRDMSGAAAQLGVKVHVVRAGKFKGAGVPGTEVTAEMLADEQRLVDQMNAFFLQTIESGRKMPRAKVETLADGRVWVATEAKELGLIDGVQSLDATLNQLTNLSKQRSQRTMSSDKTIQQAQPIVAELVPTAASVDDIRRVCQGATADFILAQLERKATVEQAMQAWIGEQQKLLVRAQEEAKQAQAAAKKPGVEALAGKLKAGTSSSQESSYDGDPRADFDAKVRDRMKQGQSRMAAIQAVARANPELHQAFLLATNPSSKAQALIRDRFASVG